LKRSDQASASLGKPIAIRDKWHWRSICDRVYSDPRYNP
jgi:hypothetical protein